MAILERTVRRVLDRMRLAVRPNATANRQGGHRSPVKAGGVEFAEHRPYVSGDDVRHIDWNAFARHGQLIVRRFEEERDARVAVLLDVTGSMSLGSPPKIELARALTASIAYVGRRQFDRVRIYPFAEGLERPAPPVSSLADLTNLERFLEDLEAAGPTSFEDAVRQLANDGAGRGLTFVISDLMTPDGWAEGFRRLGALGHDLKVIRVGCPEDEAPKIDGELELRDAETNERVRLRVSEKVRAAYTEVVREHLKACEVACRRAGGRYLNVSVDMPPERVLRRVFAGPELTVVGGAR